MSKNLPPGELINSPTYNTSNGGNFQFSVDKAIIVPNSTILNTQTPSVEIWIKTNATSQSAGLFTKQGQYTLFQSDTSLRWSITTLVGAQFSASVDTATYINTSNWYQVVGTFTSGSMKLYINGILVTSSTPISTIRTLTQGVSIGCLGGYSSGSRFQFYNGSLSTCRVYNKVLTPEEIQQNFNATRGRYGI
jgi:frataxin-like iron-binding protein CyaY